MAWTNLCCERSSGGTASWCVGCLAFAREMVEKLLGSAQGNPQWIGYVNSVLGPGFEHASGPPKGRFWQISRSAQSRHQGRRSAPNSDLGHRGRRCRVLAISSGSDQVAGTDALPPKADLRAATSAFAPISSASPPGADLPGDAPVRLVLTRSGLW